MPGEPANIGMHEHDEAPTPTSLGRLLRSERERRGLALEDIEHNLRIRRSQLEAIENDRFDQLPGDAYAIGFLRTYADFLEISREDVVRRFRTQTAGLSGRKELVFPKPISESRLPGGVILLVSIVIAVGAYGVWYFNSSAERAPLPRVTAVPDRLAPLAEAAPGRDTASTDPASAAADKDKDKGTDKDKAKDADKDGDKEPPAVASADRTPASSRPAAVAPIKPAPEPAAAEVPAAPAAAQASPEPPRAESDIPAPPSESPSTTRVFGERPDAARIVIRATGDSWVQVRDRNGNIVFARVLRDGDVYNVPNRPGLLLHTGSAGVLDLRVDGQTIPPLGRSGTVRNVMLDPDRLMAGTAISRERPRPAAAPVPSSTAIESAPLPAVNAPAAAETISAGPTPPAASSSSTAPVDPGFLPPSD